jgi:hypothetical protein
VLLLGDTPERSLFFAILFMRMCLSKMGGGNGYFRICAGLNTGSGPAGQLAELQAAGCDNIFKEKASGARTDRPELAKLIRRLDADDVLVVTRLDRLARSTRDLLMPRCHTSP